MIFVIVFTNVLDYHIIFIKILILKITIHQVISDVTLHISRLRKQVNRCKIGHYYEVFVILGLATFLLETIV